MGTSELRGGGREPAPHTLTKRRARACLAAINAHRAGECHTFPDGESYDQLCPVPYRVYRILTTCTVIRDVEGLRIAWRAVERMEGMNVGPIVVLTGRVH